MVKCHLAERLTESRRSQICFETIRIEDRDECFDCVEWGAGFGYLSGDVTSPPGKDCVDCSDAICWCLHFHIIYRFEESRGSLEIPSAKVCKGEETCQEERGIADTSGSGDDLPSSSIYWFLSETGIKYPEFDPSNRFIT